MISTSTVGVALLWALGAAAGTWLLLFRSRRRSVVGLFASVVLTGTAASIGALFGAMHEMLLPMHHWQAMLGLTVAAGAIATLAAAFAARELTRDNAEMRRAIADLAAGHVPAASPRARTAELESLRAQLTSTARSLAETRERERALEASRRELVAWVSHDLRTPLAGLRAMAEALEDGVVDDPHIYYKQIAAATDRLAVMVDDLFELSRLQAGVIAPATDRVALADLVSDCLAALLPLAQAAGVTVSGAAEDNPSMDGNAAQLSRALTNLVANAVRHTASGGHVTVRLSAEPGVATIEVGDECGGIRADDLPRVFDVGFRGEPARTPDQAANAGLGLAIAQGIVRAHDGSIDVRNSGPGCVFTITLPARSQ